jgi:hypothetical protein
MVQLWQLHFVLVYRAHYHFFYFACGFYGSIFFMVINVQLFSRILASDGLLGDDAKKYAAINRLV